MSLIFEPSTERQIQTLARSLPQALLLTGADGAGLLTTAKYLAGPALAGIIQPTNKDGQIDASGIIRIDQIRDLRQYTHGITNNQTVYIAAVIRTNLPKTGIGRDRQHADFIPLPD